MNERAQGVDAEDKEYNQEYYDQHKNTISEHRKSRYWTDPEYRAQVMARSRKRYQVESSSKDKDIGYTVKMKDRVEVFTIKHVANQIGKCEDTIRTWESKGIIPRPIYKESRGWRLYNSKQIQLLTAAFRMFDEKRWSKQNVHDYLVAHWQ